MVKNNERWWESRRIWGATLSAIICGYVAFAPEQYDLAIMIGTMLAGTLGITSWVKPKK